MSRSVWKGPFVDAHVLKKAEKARESGRNEVIKIWSRRSTILPQFVGLTFGVYNGKKHIPVSVSEDMIGQKFGGEFTISSMSSTRKPSARMFAAMSGADSGNAASMRTWPFGEVSNTAVSPRVPT